MDAYKPLRERIDVLVANRTPEDSGDGSPSQREIASLVDAMKILLRENMDTLSSSQYGNSKWFLVCLDYEMKHTVDAPVSNPVAAGSTPLPGNTSSQVQQAIH